jgi:hypothetical protein
VLLSFNEKINKSGEEHHHRHYHPYDNTARESVGFIFSYTVELLRSFLYFIQFFNILNAFSRTSDPTWKNKATFNASGLMARLAKSDGINFVVFEAFHADLLIMALILIHADKRLLKG